MEFSKKKTKWKLSMVTTANGKTKFIYRPLNANGQIILDAHMVESIFNQSK